MKNKILLAGFSILIILVIIATVFHIQYATRDTFGIFIVTALAAMGTCGVTILNVFPYEHKDKLEPVIYFRKKDIYLKITNKTNHRIYIGYDKYPYSKYADNYGVWWPTNTECTSDNATPLYAKPGDNLTISPKGSIYYQIDPQIFGRNDLSKLKIQIFTTSGDRFDVKNELIKETKKNRTK